MKKLYLLPILLLILTGCNKSEKMVCNYSYKDDTYDYTNEVTVIFNDKDEIKSVDVVMTFKNEDSAKVTCDTFKAMNRQNITCDGNTITINDYQKIIDVTNKKEIEDYFKINRYVCNK